MTSEQVANSVVYYSMGATMLSIVAIRWRRHVRTTGPLTPDLLAMLVFIGSIGTAGAVLALPTRWLLDLVYPNVAQLLGNLLVISSGGGLVAAVTFSQMDGAPAARRVRRLGAGFVVIAAAMALCFFYTHVGAAEFFVPDTHPAVIAYYTLYSAAFGWTATDLIILLSRQLRIEPVAWRRVGVQLNRAACQIILVYVVGRVWSVIAGPMGLIPPRGLIATDVLEFIIGTVLPLVGMLVGAAGLLSQVWAPRLFDRIARAETRQRHRRLYRELEPLWGLVARGSLAAVYLEERHQRTTSATLQLCGRVFELCDVELRASRHVSPQARADAVQRARRRGQSLRDAEAAGDALVLAVGVPIELQQNPPRRTHDDLISFTAVDDVAMVDVQNEAMRLLRAHQALQRSPGLYDHISSTPAGRGDTASS
jgi:hypothetical protein